MLRTLALTFTTTIAAACHKADEQPGTKECYLNQRCEILEGQSAAITDTTRNVRNNSTGQYEHPVFTAKFEKVIRDDREFGSGCVVADFGRVYTSVSLTGGSEYLTDTFSYPECFSGDLSVNAHSPHLETDSVQLYLLKTRPVPEGSSYQKEDHPYSIEVTLKRQ